jgi:TRAP-type C4-dicarboxylate transport system permease small subunit
MEKRALVTVAEAVLGALMLVGVCITFANVIGRYVFGTAIYWAEEILVFIVIWGVFVGLIVLTYKGEYLSMDLFTAHLRGRARFALDLLVTAVLVACCAYAAWQSWQVLSLFIQTDQRTVSAGIPKAIPHAALLVGLTLVPVAALLRLRARFRGGS